MTKKINISRREFLRNASLLSAAGSIATPFALNMFAMNVAAASTYTTDYKALVCIYMGGGNDHNNTVLATDDVSWRGYQEARNGSGSVIALARSLITEPVNTAIVPSVTQGRTFALHPAMGLMKDLFVAQRAAVVANVGSLIKPITSKAHYQSLTAAEKPANLFSHNDQTAQWHSTDPSKPIYGWGGRMLDQLQLSNNAGKLNYTSCISTAGNSVFLAGEQIHQYQINSNGSATPVGGLTSLFDASPSNLQNIISTPTSSNLFEVEHTRVMQRAIAAQSDLSAVMGATTGLTTDANAVRYTLFSNSAATANNSLAIQLRTVARIIAGQNYLGAHRQVFFVNIGGFDTHDGQAPSHGELMARLAHAVSYFDTTLKTLSVFNSTLTSSTPTDMSANVTTFTASDFGRTFTSNGDGTDHGWGAHHFVVGGAVNGGNIYGTFPVTAVHGRPDPMGGTFNNPIDVGSGNTIPQISVDQYAATMANWFGLDTTEINNTFPNLTNFSGTSPLNSASYRDLGFMKPA